MLEAAEVEHHHVAVLDDAVAHLVVRVRPVRARADHGEVDLRVPEPAKERGQLVADLGLAPAGEAHLEDLAVRLVGGRPGCGEAAELVVVLDRPQHRQRGRHRHVRRVGQPALQPEQVHRPGGVGQRVAPRLEQARGRLVGIAAVGPVDELEDGCAGRAFGVGSFELGHDHRRLAVDGDDQHGDAFGDRDRRVPGEVEQVGAGGEQQAGQARLGRGLRCSPQPHGEVLGGEWSRCSRIGSI